MERLGRREGRPAAGRRAAGAGRDPEEARRGLPPRAVGRDAPAGDDRDGPRLRPAIVIGDEPTTALDVMVQAQILELLEHLRAELGLSLILITHDLSVIAETCDRVLIMYAGRVAEEGRSTRSSGGRATRTRRSSSAFPNIHTDRRSLEVIPGSPPDLRHPPPGCRFAPRCVRDGRLSPRSSRPRSRSTASGSRATSTPRAATAPGTPTPMIGHGAAPSPTATESGPPA